MKKKIFWGIIILFFGSVATFYLLYGNNGILRTPASVIVPLVKFPMQNLEFDFVAPHLLPQLLEDINLMSMAIPDSFTESWNTYEGNEFGFSVKYPSSWTLERRNINAGNDTAVVFVSPSNDIVFIWGGVPNPETIEEIESITVSPASFQEVTRSNPIEYFGTNGLYGYTYLGGANDRTQVITKEGGSIIIQVSVKESIIRAAILLSIKSLK